MQRPISKSDLKYSKKVADSSGVEITVIERPMGLGDTVKNFLHSGIVGVVVHKLTGMTQPCEKCRKRQDKLNSILGYNYDFEW